jgi:hypothetical protein
VLRRDASRHPPAVGAQRAAPNVRPRRQLAAQCKGHRTLRRFGKRYCVAVLGARTLRPYNARRFAGPQGTVSALLTSESRGLPAPETIPVKPRLPSPCADRAGRPRSRCPSLEARASAETRLYKSGMGGGKKMSLFGRKWHVFFLFSGGPFRIPLPRGSGSRISDGEWSRGRSKVEMIEAERVRGFQPA